jgi:hypothetical protein
LNRSIFSIIGDKKTFHSQTKNPPSSEITPWGIFGISQFTPLFESLPQKISNENQEGLLWTMVC